MPTEDETVLFLIFTVISGDINLCVDKTTPPFGVALPVKLVCPAEIVIGILHNWHVFNIIPHCITEVGLTSISAKPPGILDQSIV